MPTSQDEQLRARIAARRVELSLTQEQLGQAAGLTKFQVNRIESGVKTITAGELAALANALEVPVSSLLGGSGKTGALAFAARLTAGERETDVQQPLERLAGLIELDDLLSKLVATPHRPNVDVTVHRTGGYVAQAVRTAGEVRAAVGLSPADPIEDLPALLECFGIDVTVEPLPKNVTGLVVTDAADTDSPRAVRLVAVTSKQVWGRQRFTMAHELGHVLFGDGKLVVDRTTTGGGPKPMVESRADAFAAALLSPEEGLRGLMAEYAACRGVVFPIANDGQASELTVLASERFGTSVDSMRYRLKNVGALTSEQCARLKKGHRGRMFEAAGLSAAWQEWEAVQGAVLPPRRLLEAALFAYRDGLLGLRPIAELYGRDDLPALRADLHAAGWMLADPLLPA